MWVRSLSLAKFCERACCAEHVRPQKFRTTMIHIAIAPANLRPNLINIVIRYGRAFCERTCYAEPLCAPKRERKKL